MPIPASNLSPEKRFMGLFIGRSGSGKTCAECTFISPQSKKDGKRIRVFDFDGRIRGILGCQWIDRSIVDYEYYPPRAGIGDKSTFVKLNNDFATLQTQCQSGQNPYETIILDSLTSQTFALLCDALVLTHQTSGKGGDKKGKYLGTMAMPGPEDYGFESNGTYQLLAFLRSLPIPNIIVSAHIVERYGKADPNDSYSESVVVGEKLSIRDKIGENVFIYFDNVFRFERRLVGGEVRHFATFRSDIARTTFAELPDGPIDITGKDFYQGLTRLTSYNQTAGAAGESK